MVAVEDDRSSSSYLMILKILIICPMVRALDIAAAQARQLFPPLRLAAMRKNNKQLLETAKYGYQTREGTCALRVQGCPAADTMQH